MKSKKGSTLPTAFKPNASLSSPLQPQPQSPLQSPRKSGSPLKNELTKTPSVVERLGNFVEGLLGENEDDGSKKKKSDDAGEMEKKKTGGLVGVAVSYGKKVLEAVPGLVSSFGSRAGIEYYEGLLNGFQLSPIKALSWHRNKQILAILHRQDVVHVYNISTEEWIPWQSHGLMNDFQTDVTCIEWKPNAGMVLAVGCRNGVGIWEIFPGNSPTSNAGISIDSSHPLAPTPQVFASTPSKNPFLINNRPTMRNAIAPAAFPPYTPYSQQSQSQSQTTSQAHHIHRPRSTWVNFLSHPSLDCITSIAWSPNGTLLAVGSATSPNIVIWDTAFETSTLLSRGTGVGTRKLMWSGNGRYLVQVCVKRTLRVWETDGWNSCELEAAGKGGFVDAVWLSDERSLAFVVEGVARISMLQMSGEPPALNYLMHTQSEKLPQLHYNVHHQEIRVGGPIKCMELDPTGTRMVVTFEGTSPGSELISLFGIKFAPIPALDFIGFIRGPQWQPNSVIHPSRRKPHGANDVGTGGGSTSVSGNESGAVGGGADSGMELDIPVESDPLPVVVKFAGSYGRGALLSVGWENGKVGFVPMYYQVKRERK
ncbi:hypothetical protein HDU76_009090 [Blyttiomyces sp. JEL0837]|nr:hypothetical protein HDU76_009090 [Blyttiomyces sp. JEL0837]